MLAKICLNFLILCGVLSQGIIGIISEKDIVDHTFPGSALVLGHLQKENHSQILRSIADESSELLVRQKRVVNRTPGAETRVQMKDFPYVVSVKAQRHVELCAGVILTNRIVLTVAKCVELETEIYRVYSGVARLLSNSHPIIHKIRDKKILVGTHPHRPDDGIALITVFPPFIYSINTKNIEFYEGFIPGGTLGTIIGWGSHTVRNSEPMQQPVYLRSITVPIISYLDCALVYLNRYAITERDICTLDTDGLQYCGIDDVGAPLVTKVLGVNKLVGVHLRTVGGIGQGHPDIFVDLRNSIYQTWIRQTIHHFETHLNRPNQNQHLPHNPPNQANLHHPHNLPQ